MKFNLYQDITMFKKLFIVFISLLLVTAAGLFIFVFVTGPVLPAETDKIIADTLASQPVDETPGKAGFAVSSGVKIWYKSVSPGLNTKGDILLIAGIAVDSTWWPPCFVKSLTDAGYRVIMFDNRGTGMSDWMMNWKFRGYNLKDMARDSAAVLDSLGIKEAHIIGVSMGGMIAQQMAISYPAKIKSLTSIMSSGDIEDNKLPRAPWSTVRNVVRLSLRYGLGKSEVNIIKLHLSIHQLFRNSKLPSDDIKMISGRVLYNIRLRRGFNSEASAQQLAAIKNSPSRYDELKKLQKPALIIHGMSDPLIPYEHGEKCSQLIPGASLVLVEGMGHDIPCSYSGGISEKIINFISGKKIERRLLMPPALY